MTQRKHRDIGFAPPPIDEDSIKAVKRVLQSGWITSGPELAKFETELSNYLEAQSVLCFSSWTSASELALRWFGIGPGDDVLIPAMTYAATANIVLHCGARPVLVDIDPSERIVTAESLAKAWTPQTKAVMPVDLGGWPVDYDAINRWLSSPEIRNSFQPTSPVQEKMGRPLFLSDAAHSFGARYKGKAVGTQADITGFSFHAVKNLTTAEGGALAFNLPDTFDMDSTNRWFRSMALHGQSKSALEKSASGTWHYDVIEAGFKCNMTDIQAAIGRSQLQKYPVQLQRRQALADIYHTLLSEHAWYIAPPLTNQERTSSFHLFSMRIASFQAEQRDLLMTALREDGIATNVHFMPLPMLTLHKNRGENLEEYPESERCFNEQISLPIHLQLSDDDIHWIVERVVSHVSTILHRKP